MKKLLVVVAVVAVGFAFTSCKKDCVCSGKVTVLGIETVVPEYSAGEMSTADCEAVKYAAAAPGAVVDVKCKSK